MTTEEALEAIIADLTDRRGLRHEWANLDLDVEAEIREAWLGSIRAAVEREREARDWLERNSVMRAPDQQSIADYLAAVGESETLPGGRLSYETPRDGWVCFHCGVRFKTERAAREHFGEKPRQEHNR